MFLPDEVGPSAVKDLADFLNHNRSGFGLLHAKSLRPPRVKGAFFLLLTIPV